MDEKSEVTEGMVWWLADRLAHTTGYAMKAKDFIKMARENYQEGLTVSHDLD